MESTDEQTTEMEKQQSHTVAYGRNKATHDQQKENYRGPQSVDFATMTLFVWWKLPCSR